MPFIVNICLLATVLMFSLVNAERHLVSFNNRCGYGTPKLIRGDTILSQGEDYLIQGSLMSAIAYLQTGECDFNGIHCLLVETTLRNPTCPGCGSSTDLSLIPQHKFNVPVRFEYWNGCNATGVICDSPECMNAFFDAEDNHVQVQCQENDVNLLIEFC